MAAHGEHRRKSFLSLFDEVPAAATRLRDQDMAGRTSTERITESDYENLLTALSGNAKGRAFLTEYRRRSGPEETVALLDALERIESAIAGVRDQLTPERIADELRRIAMLLEIATSGASADPEGDEAARRMALIGRARVELSMLAGSLSEVLALTDRG